MTVDGDTPGERRLFVSAAARRQFLLHVLAASLALVGVALVLRPYWLLLADAEALRRTVARFGVWAPLAFVVLQAAQVVLAPIPGQVLAVVAGYLFGTWWGTLYNVVGITLGSTVAFWLSRRFGRRYVESTFDAEALEWFDAVTGDRGLLVLFVLFVLPGLPDDLLCFVGGLTTIPLRRLVLVAVIGRVPGFFLVNAFGDLLARGEPVAAVLLAVVLVSLSLVGYHYRHRLLARLSSGRGDEEAS